MSLENSPGSGFRSLSWSNISSEPHTVMESAINSIPWDQWFAEPKPYYLLVYTPYNRDSRVLMKKEDLWKERPHKAIAESDVRAVSEIHNIASDEVTTFLPLTLVANEAGLWELQIDRDSHQLLDGNRNPRLKDDAKFSKYVKRLREGQVTRLYHYKMAGDCPYGLQLAYNCTVTTEHVNDHFMMFLRVTSEIIANMYYGMVARASLMGHELVELDRLKQMRVESQKLLNQITELRLTAERLGFFVSPGSSGLFAQLADFEPLFLMKASICWITRANGQVDFNHGNHPDHNVCVKLTTAHSEDTIDEATWANYILILKQIAKCNQLPFVAALAAHRGSNFQAKFALLKDVTHGLLHPDSSGDTFTLVNLPQMVGIVLECKLSVQQEHPFSLTVGDIPTDAVDALLERYDFWKAGRYRLFTISPLELACALKVLLVEELAHRPLSTFVQSVKLSCFDRGLSLEINCNGRLPVEKIHWDDPMAHGMSRCLAVLAKVAGRSRPVIKDVPSLGATTIQTIYTSCLSQFVMLRTIDSTCICLFLENDDAPMPATEL